jgi:hypothetical protein
MKDLIQQLNLNIRLQPKQAMFWNMVEHGKASWLGYGGSRGGAKSGGLRRILLKRRLDYPGTRCILLRRVWDDVNKNHVQKMWEEFPSLQQYYKSVEKGIFLPNGSVFYFDAAENQTDVERKAYGPEFMDVAIDQAEQFSGGEMAQLKTINRWPGLGLGVCKMLLGFNPGGQGAAFLQRIFYTKKFEGAENPDDYAFLQAFGWDNYEWCRAGMEEEGLTEQDFYSWSSEKRFVYYTTKSQYGKEQNALPPHKRPGQLLGSFKKFEGQYFNNWEPEVHVWPFDDIDFKPNWPRWISVDWGFQHHAAVSWHCQAGEWMENGKRKRLVITYRSMIRQGISEGALAEEICEANDGDKIRNIYGGHDLWAKTSTKGAKEKKMNEVFKRNGLPTMKRARTERIDGWRFIYNALEDCEWIVTDNCTEVVEAIPMAVFNTKANSGMGNEDIIKTDTKEDDMLDCVRYGLWTQYAPKRKGDEQKAHESTAHLTDLTSRAIHYKKVLGDIGKKRSRAITGSLRSCARALRGGRKIA